MKIIKYICGDIDSSPKVITLNRAETPVLCFFTVVVLLWVYH